MLAPGLTQKTAVRNGIPTQSEILVSTRRAENVLGDLQRLYPASPLVTSPWSRHRAR
jgi:hypothetical protein